MEALLEVLELAGADAGETLKYMQKYAEIDSLLGSRDGLKTTDPDYKETKAKLQAIHAELVGMMRADIDK